MPEPTRRRFLASGAALPLLTATRVPSSDTIAAIADDLHRYIAFGSKQAGGDGDNACGEWLASELQRIGFGIERQTVSVPWFEPDRSELRADNARAALWPQPIVVPTPVNGITASLVRVDAAGRATTSLQGAIALIDIPFARWSTALSKEIRQPVQAAFTAGAQAAIVVTNGPTGRIIALNTDGRKPIFGGPVALMAPGDAGPFFARAVRRGDATLYLSGKGGRRPAFNFAARLDRGKGRWLTVSTPRSGWFTCAGERGGGVTAWLHIARWALRNAPEHDLAFICNSGHEYQYLGAEESLHAIAPKPGETAFWLHLGANLAARDWHEAVGGMRPLPGTDSQRYLVVSPDLQTAAARTFAGLAGLEAPYASDELSAGELTGIIEAGYGPVAGVFGIHRFHHVDGDDERCVSADHVARTTLAFRNLIEHALEAQ